MGNFPGGSSGGIGGDRQAIGSGLSMRGIMEAAGSERIVPGQITPIGLLGVKVMI